MNFYFVKIRNLGQVIVSEEFVVLYVLIMALLTMFSFILQGQIFGSGYYGEFFQGFEAVTAVVFRGKT